MCSTYVSGQTKYLGATCFDFPQETHSVLLHTVWKDGQLWPISDFFFFINVYLLVSRWGPRELFWSLHESFIGLSKAIFQNCHHLGRCWGHHFLSLFNESHGSPVAYAGQGVVLGMLTHFWEEMQPSRSALMTFPKVTMLCNDIEAFGFIVAKSHILKTMRFVQKRMLLLHLYKNMLTLLHVTVW